MTSTEKKSLKKFLENGVVKDDFLRRKLNETMVNRLIDVLEELKIKNRVINKL